MKKKNTNAEHKERINEVMYHIYKNLSSKLNIEDLSKVSVSKSYIMNGFQPESLKPLSSSAHVVY